jgi:phosphomevalonate kinase
VKITLASTQQEYHSVTAPGYMDGSWRFLQDSSGAIRWQDELPRPSTFALLENIWQRIPLDSSLRLSVCIDSSEFFDAASGLKLGIGSSAAVATALTQALYCFTDTTTEAADSFRTAEDAHASFQGGHGSGVDIAASFRGGLIKFRKGAGRLPPRVAWPVGLFSCFLWSGRPAATTSQLHKLQNARHSGESVASLHLAAEDIASNWSVGAVERVMESFRRYVDALRQFDVDHDLGIFDAGHAGLVEMATGDDIVYKPCGAGGGDIGVVFAPDKESVIDFCQQAKKHNFVQLDIEPDRHGVTACIGKEIE